MLHKLSGIEKVRDKGGGASITIFRQIVLSHSFQSSRRGMLLCVRKFRVSIKIMPKRGTSRFLIENLLSHCSEKLRRGTYCCQ